MNYALFQYMVYEAGGGIHDLEMIGTFEACIHRAETSHPPRQSAHIAELPSLRIVRQGKWGFDETNKPVFRWYEP